jgi:glycosyltransferase involved in cell wall biosynthesis
LKLVIVHYHLRPGGIRRVIELATPHLIRHFDTKIEAVVLACGEAGDQKWNDYFEEQLAPTPVVWMIDPAFNYLSEQRRSPTTLTRNIRAGTEELLRNATPDNCLVWAHNLGIARNLLLTRELISACERRRIPIIAHHHDWWFENRWLRWPEMRRFGFRTLSAVAHAIFPAAKNLHHVAINRSDALILQRHFPNRAGWLPNLAQRTATPPKASLQSARKWLQRELNARDSPIWIVPCRLLRRKNLAEALLVKQWLRSDAWLVTTGGVSSADEQAYANELQAAASRFRWRLRLGILQGDEATKPRVAELLAVGEVVLLTSIQEGFGLPYLEAAAARRPLIARALPNISPDLSQFGFRFPQLYEELLIDPSLFDREAERKRQQRLFHAWRRQLPHACHSWVGKPALLGTNDKSTPVPFSGLTLTAQLEVLFQPCERSWELCAPLNPFLIEWKKRAEQRRLQLTPWPRMAGDWLSGRAYARRFAEILRGTPGHAPGPKSGLAAHEDFIREKLGSEHLFPLLWSRES